MSNKDEKSGPKLEKLRSINADDLSNVRAALCLYDPERDRSDTTFARIEKLPGITADDLSKVRGALCLYDPKR